MEEGKDQPAERDALTDRMVVKKLDGARRQVESAIRLLLDDQDPIAIHTLVCAARVILQDLSNRQKTKYWTVINSQIEPSKQKKLWQSMNRAANFLKHADRDPGATLAGIDERVNDHMLYICTQMYRSLGQELTQTMISYLAWHSAVYPDLWEGIPKKRAIGEISSMYFPDLPKLSRAAQLRAGKGFLDAPNRVKNRGVVRSLWRLIVAVIRRLTSRLTATK